MKILYFGDVVGKPGRRAVRGYLSTAARREPVDFVVANGENASGGIGIDPGTAREMLSGGVDVLTSGNHIWHHKEIHDYLDASERLLRPANFTPGVPGRGWAVFETRAGTRIGVINLIGRVFMGLADCPFRVAEELLARVRERTELVLVDMHAEATSEKVGMGRYLDARVSAVVGSHTHVQTADECILEGGTAYITDAGMCGPTDSVIGMRADQVLKRFVDQLPVRFEVGRGKPMVQGVLIDVDEASGRARSIRRIREVVEERAE
jgi:metallophosphoesterase (TIGR00282 family)